MRRAPPLVVEPDRPPPRRLGRRWLALIVGLALSPFAVDLFNVVRVNWDLMRGIPYPHAPTPALDWVGDLANDVRRSAWGLLGRRLHEAPWKPVPTILFAVGWAFAAGLLLRGSNRR